MKCEGCEEDDFTLLIEGEIVPRFMPAEPARVKYCVCCWEAVDGCDHETGSWGAACIDVKRWIPLDGRIHFVVVQPQPV